MVDMICKLIHLLLANQIYGCHHHFHLCFFQSAPCGVLGLLSKNVRVVEAVVSTILMSDDLEVSGFLSFDLGLFKVLGFGGF